MTKDRRLYARFDIGMDEHAKIIDLSDAAFRALFESTFYSRRQLTDGFLDERVVLRKWGHDVAQELSSNHPERPSWVKVEGGWAIRDFAEHQTTTVDITAKREAGRLGGLAKAKQAASKPLAPAKQKASTTLAKTETETEKRKTSSSPATPSMEFELFWSAYPKKVSKQAAIKAWNKAVKNADPAAIIQGAKRYAEAERGTERRFLKGPDGWLNAGRWMDETAGDAADLDPDVILGPDYWMVPMPPTGLSIQEELAWKKARRAEHEAERLEEARRKVASG